MKCNNPSRRNPLQNLPQEATPSHPPSRQGMSMRDLIVRGGTFLLAASAGALPGAAAQRPMPLQPQPTAGGHPGPIIPWTGTWSAAPQSSSLEFSDQTLRQIIHTSIGGHSARLHLSNLFGNETAEISDVHIARQASGSAVVESTQRRVTFAGEDSVAIEAGQVAISDAIDLHVPALSNLAISLYVPGSIASATCHTLASQTNFLADGNLAHEPQLNTTETFGSYCFVSNLDIESPLSRGAVVALGASVTDGYASPVNANHRWPDFLAARLARAHKDIGVLNQGISGNRLLTNMIGDSALNRLSRDALTQPHARWVIFSDDPINDIGANLPPRSSSELIAGYQSLIAQTHGAGLKILCSTMTPYEGAFYWTQAGEVERQAINAFVRSPHNGCDAIVDQDTATHDPAHPTRYLPIYDSGDHLHPSDAGREAIANAVNLDALD